MNASSETIWDVNLVNLGQKVDVKHVGKSVLPHQQNVPNTVTTVNTASDLNNDDVTSERQVVAEDKKQGLLQCYVVFDLLMLNGVVLSAKRLQERLSILKGNKTADIFFAQLQIF